MERVLLVTNAQGFMIMSMKDKITEAGLACDICGANADAIAAFVKDTSVILLYADEDMAKDATMLTYVKDQALENDIAVYSIGNPDDEAAISEIIPGSVLLKNFIRPVNMPEVIAEIDKYMKSDFGAIKKKILVVDDSGAYLRSVKGWLDGKYHVIPANSGAMAIKYISTNKPDLILLDYEMPVCDGKQVLEMIRSEADFADIPVIFLTSKDDKESVLAVMSLKPEGYLLKTMPPAQIIKTVDDFFARKKAETK